MKKLFAATLMIAGVTATYADTTAVVGNVTSGEGLSAMCTSCHGPQGNSGPGFPKLAGQQASYIVKQLQNFKDGTRQNAVMAPMAMGLTPQQMADLGAYFYAQKVTAFAAVDPAQYKLGQKLYFGGDANRGIVPCAGCHGPKGAGVSGAKFPRIGGQHADYVKLQLTAFRAAGREDENPAVIRTNDSAKKGEKGMMQEVASKLSDKDINALSAYISGLH